MENIQRSGYTSSGGGGGAAGGAGGSNSCGRSKKAKQKKVPQRGLGVAQLEKIRLEEQQKKDAALQAANLLAKSIISPSSNSIPLAPPSPNDLPSRNSSSNLAQSIPNVEFLNPNSVQFSKPLNIGGGEVGLAWHRLWNGELNLEGSELRGFAIRPHMNFPYEKNPNTTGFLPLHHFQPAPRSSMVNVSSGISPSSSLLNFQTEPPSNQSYLGTNYRPFWPEEEKMVGIKRSYPFSMETPTPPAPSFQGKLHPTHLTTISGSDESGSCSYGCTIQMEPSVKKYGREDPSTSNPRPQRNASEITAENRGLNGDFLTLAPPVATSTSSPLGSEHKHSFAYPCLHGQELSDLDYARGQESGKDEQQRSIQQPVFTFFPAKVQLGQGTTTFADNGNGEKHETIDLNLKL